MSFTLNDFMTRIHFKVSVGHFTTTIGHVRFNDVDDSSTSISTSSIVFIVVGVSVIIILVLLVVIIVLMCPKNLSSKFKRTPAVNTDVNMYSSPAYGSHQVYSEPGLDHLYESLDGVVNTETNTALHDAPQPETSDDVIDQDGYLKMASVADCSAPEVPLDHTTENKRNDQPTTNSTVVDQGIGDLVSKSTNEEDNDSNSGYGQAMDYLRDKDDPTTNLSQSS